MKITHIMLCLNILTKTDKWLHAYNFNQYEDVFIGHRGCARISDTQKKYPFLVEVRNDPLKPRLYEYRLNWENLDSGMEKLKELDRDTWLYLKDILDNKGIKIKIKRLVPMFQENGTVKMIETYDI